MRDVTKKNKKKNSKCSVEFPNDKFCHMLKPAAALHKSGNPAISMFSDLKQEFSQGANDVQSAILPAGVSTGVH